MGEDESGERHEGVGATQGLTDVKKGLLVLMTTGPSNQQQATRNNDLTVRAR